MIEKINNTLTKAKELIKDNKIQEALTVLCSLSIKNKEPLYDDVMFEIAKIYLISEEYSNSLKILKKIKKENLLPYVYDMIFKIYKLFGDTDSLVKTYKRNLRYYNQNIEYTKTIIEILILSNMFKDALNFLSIYRTKFGNDVFLENKLEEIYKKICIYIQNLNIENNYKETKKFFKNIYRLIPTSEYKVRNILLNEYEIASNKVILKSIPRQLTVLLTNRCNLRCIMCNPHNKENIYYELSNENCEELLNIIPYLDRLILQGGEVLLYGNFYKIIKKASEYNICVEIVTNGLLLNEKILNILTNMNSVLTISIDGFNKKTYEKIRVGGNFDKLIYNLKILSKIKKEKSNKMMLRLQMVVMKSNYKHINMALSFAKKYCFDEISLIPIRSGVALSKECIFDLSYDKKIMEFIEINRNKVEKKADKLNIKLIDKLPNISDSKCIVRNKIEHTPILKYKDIKIENICKNTNKKNNNVFCFLPWKTAYYNNVSLLPTCFCPGKENKFVYKKNRESILKYWNAETMLLYRKELIKHRQKLICNELCLNDIILKKEKKSIIY